MPDKYQVLQRALSLLRGLQRDTMTRDELMRFVQGDFALDAYPDPESSRDRRQFENDLKILRKLGMDIEYVRSENYYRLLSFGEFSPLCLTDDELATLAFLAEAFQPGAPNSDAVQHLIRRMLDFLPDRQQGEVYGRRQRLRLDLRRRDTGAIQRDVQAAIDRAVSGRRVLRFAYRAPGQSDGMPRIHTVQPWNYVFDTTRGHYYLDAYRLQVEGPYGIWNEGQWQRYRPERILTDGLRVLPDRLPPTPPKRPRHRLAYRLAPEIARLGQITRHFDDMKVGDPDGDGWVPVTASTDDLFRAVRLLLSYGPACEVTGGREARREMRRLVEAMAQLYTSSDKK
jgi:predicted DNA-binding transcriptional regulator YafY